MTPRSVLAGIGASMMFACMSVAIKTASVNSNTETIVLLRNGFGLLFLLPLLCRHPLAGLKTQRLRSHLARALSGLAAMYCFFYTLGHMPLAEAVLLNYSSPIFTALLAWLWLNEKSAPHTLFAVMLGLAGVACILKPGVAVWSPVASIGALSGLLAALAMLNIRRMADSEPIWRIVFYFSGLSLLISLLPFLAGVGQFRAAQPQVWWAMLLAGGCATLGQLFLTYGYSHAPAAKMGTLNYLTVVFAALLGWWGWQETPDAWSLLGAVLIVAAGVLVSRNTPLTR